MMQFQEFQQKAFRKGLTNFAFLGMFLFLGNAFATNYFSKNSQVTHQKFYKENTDQKTTNTLLFFENFIEEEDQNEDQNEDDDNLSNSVSLENFTTSHLRVYTYHRAKSYNLAQQNLQKTYILFHSLKIDC